MTVSQPKADSIVEWGLKTIFGSISLIIVSIGVVMFVSGYLMAITNLHPLLGSMFGLWGGTAIILGGVIYVSFTAYRRRSDITAEASREFFSE